LTQSDIIYCSLYLTAMRDDLWVL